VKLVWLLIAEDRINNDVRILTCFGIVSLRNRFLETILLHKDILNDDYSNKFSLKAKKNAGPVAFTLETEQSKDGSLAPKVGSKFSYGKFNVDKLQIKADGGKVLETSMAVTPEIKLSFKASNSAELIVEYVKGNVNASTSINPKDLTKAYSAIAVSHPSGLKVGGDVSFGISGPSAGLTSFNAGFNYTQGPLLASVVASNKFSKFEVGLLYKVNDELTLASVTSHSSENPCTVAGIGGAYKSAAVGGTIKAKWGSDHVIHALYAKEVLPKVTVVATASVKANDFSTVKPGISLSF
jgi:voltage-dependent anion channel protein 2